MPTTKQRLWQRGHKEKFYNTRTKNSAEYEVSEIVERAHGAALAKGTDEQGHPVRKFVARGTRLEK